MSADPEATRDNSSHLQRGLRGRHLQLIAIGGAIGTGLFMGSGKTIALAGPSIVFVYLTIGIVLFFVMRALGELLLSNLAYKSFTDFCGDLLGPGAAFFVGWTYWLCWVVTGTADVVAIAAYTQFWLPDLPAWIPALACIALLLCLNLVHVALFGEMEFWFAMVKIVTILALIAAGAVMVATGFAVPGSPPASIAHWWQDGGMFPHGLSGFFAGFQIAVFAFVGIELVGTAAAETHDPRRTLPRAINAIPIRILIFYVGALLAIMAVTPWSSVSPDRSPFVALFALAGIPAAAGLINFVVLSSAASSANSGIFSTSRMLYGLGLRGQAPSVLTRLSKSGVPSRGLQFSCVCLLFAVALIYWIPDVMTVFTLVTTVSALLFMFVWTMILLSYLRYRRTRPAQHLASAYKMPGGRPMCVIVLIFFAAILLMLWQRADTRAALCATPLWFLVLSLAWWRVRQGPGGRVAPYGES
ncbi:D-serine/D-alanine/glycine transporter [Robbsia sp. KACC 23696]|uniref:D-serine/D-alanine/glycine transporter n=1 Tax=Robbsia sp. KACC 23696 TaxID=3149231 RepID=UPI00325B7E7D